MIVDSAIYNVNKNMEAIQVYGYMLFVCGLLFLVAGVSINIRLKRYFKDFYKDHKIILWVATYGLSIPVMTRGVFDVLRNEIKSLDIWIGLHGSLFSPLMYVFGDLIPLVL